MKETEEIMGMIKEEGAAYFARERGNKVEVGLYLEHIIEERGMKKKDIVRKLNLEESYARKLFGGQNFIKEADTGEGLKFPANVQKYMLYVIPAIVVVIYLKGYYDMFSPMGPVVLTVWMLVSLLVLGLVGWIIFGKNKTK